MRQSSSLRIQVCHAEPVEVRHTSFQDIDIDKIADPSTGSGRHSDFTYMTVKQAQIAVKRNLI
jgi:hypothetical protein